jgi:hypothetical protein
MYTTHKSYFEASRFVDSAKVETSIVDSLDKMLEEKEEYKTFDELMI